MKWWTKACHVKNTFISYLSLIASENVQSHFDHMENWFIQWRNVSYMVSPPCILP